MPGPVGEKLDYQNSSSERRPFNLAKFGGFTGIVASLSLLLAIFIQHGGAYWYPYVEMPIGNWIGPILIGSIILGIVSIFTSFIGVLRLGSVPWKAFAIFASSSYWAGFGCVVMFRLV